MELNFDLSLQNNYHSHSQQARVFTENWVQHNMYCPHCGNPVIEKFPNNKPVADFFCPECKREYELKSKNGTIAHKVADGAYHTMIERITSNKNPDFFFMNYSKESLSVVDFLFVPKHFFVPEIIEKRKELKETARRAGWVGCNILIDQIPKQGIIPIIEKGKINSESNVIESVNRGLSLKTDNIQSRGWIMDVLKCINSLPVQFNLNDVYLFSKYLSEKHPENNNIHAKIRQQLQFLRDKGFIMFNGNGKYTKI